VKTLPVSDLVDVIICFAGNEKLLRNCSRAVAKNTAEGSYMVHIVVHQRHEELIDLSILDELEIVTHEMEIFNFALANVGTYGGLSITGVETGTNSACDGCLTLRSIPLQPAAESKRAEKPAIAVLKPPIDVLSETLTAGPALSAPLSDKSRIKLIIN